MFVHALADYLVDEDGGGHGDIQGFDVPEEGNLNHFVAYPQVVGCHSGVFRSHDNGGGAVVGDVGIVRMCLFACRIYLYAGCLQEADGLGDAFFFAYGQRVQGACGGLDGIGIDCHASFGRNDDGVDTGTFAGTGNRPEVADIGDAVQQQDERIFALFINVRSSKCW